MDWKDLGDLFGGALPSLLTFAGVWLSNRERFSCVDKQFDALKSSMDEQFSGVDKRFSGVASASMT